MSVFSPPFEKLTQYSDYRYMRARNSSRVIISSVESASLSSGACASSRTAYSSSACRLCGCVNFSHLLRLLSAKKPLCKPLTHRLFSKSASSSHLQGSGSQAEHCGVLFYTMPGSGGLPHPMLAFHLMSFQAMFRFTDAEFSKAGIQSLKF